MPQPIAEPSIPAQATKSSSESNRTAALGQPRGGIPDQGKRPLFAPRVERLLRLIAEIERDSRERDDQETRS
jgi:hypothetical protein